MHSHFISDHIAAAEESIFVQGSRDTLKKKHIVFLDITKSVPRKRITTAVANKN